jgi:hypothetical protein
MKILGCSRRFWENYRCRVKDVRFLSVQIGNLSRGAFVAKNLLAPVAILALFFSGTCLLVAGVQSDGKTITLRAWGVPTEK